MEFPRQSTLALIQRALDEDIRSGDITTRLTFDDGDRLRAKIVAKAKGILAGAPIAQMVFDEMKAEVGLKEHKKDGEFIDVGDLIFEIEGKAADLLEAERTILNFMQMLSGVATYTHAFARQIAHTSTRILDTRKTLPGHRLLQKYAVSIGGGVNHRMGLFDMVMLKENHIHAAGGLQSALQRVFTHLPEGMKVEVEVEKMEQIDLCLRYPVYRILLDNMDNEMTRRAVEKIRRAGHAMQIEASGNMTLDRVASVAETGVDFISVGALTHSVQAFDFSMRYV